MSRNAVATARMKTRPDGDVAVTRTTSDIAFVRIFARDGDRLAVTLDVLLPGTPIAQDASRRAVACHLVLSAAASNATRS
ncbi:hypothetical protein [Palleronia pelagia]|uniref:hypothetical protein n=1 Tax=Palleronia pelagia TaxID=387096 RepID=UPI000B84B6A5|nr:hypothetical protein [Palleronia pelagia]